MSRTTDVLSVFWCFTAVVLAEAPQCGKPPLGQNRVVGGIDANEGAWPWQVDIQTQSAGHVCGGSLISESWVLSAAHCFPNVHDLGPYIIYVGRHKQKGFNMHQESHRVRRVVVPESYVEPQRGNDLALVELSRPVFWSDYVQPICVPDQGALFPGGLDCMVTGWGHIRDNVALPGLGVLQQVRVPIISSPSCQQLFDVNPGDPEDHVEILPDELCAGYPEGGRDACQGDSGGPLVCSMANATWVQAGVVSFGLGCAAKNRPGVYARVSSFSDLIRSTVPGIRLHGRAPQTRTWGPTAGLFLLFIGHSLVL
ncbi:serine protease 33-like [Gadus chalcogrammus]|uniref:serine protease 33-like n=1 Tax=Gadus chalcogrammus TaxID=1042646 RepID=UPI0024C4CCA2|nr:serine protease 33-like [Gadus chalcogrammus]